MLLFDITEQKNLVEEGQMLRSYNTNALHTTYSGKNVRALVSMVLY